MSENKSKYDTIKQYLQSLSINSEQFHDKLTYINQTRTKITNELANLTKDYDRKIKQLQSKLDDALSKNQLLLRQNSLYQKDIEAFQVRLVEKQKLITMLILQQSDKVSFSDTVIGRTKSQLVQKSDIKIKDFGKAKDKKDKNYENILPSNINEKDPKIIQSNVQQNLQKQQPKNKQPLKATNSAHHQLQNPSQIEQSPKQQAKQEVIKKNVPPPPPAKKNNKIMQKPVIEIKKELTKVESQQKIVYHSQASVNVENTFNIQNTNQDSAQDHKQTLVADESQVIQQFEEKTPKNSQVEPPNPQQQLSQQRTIIPPPPPAQKKKSAVPPPKRMPIPRKNVEQPLDEQQSQNFDLDMKNDQNKNIVEPKHQSEQKQDNVNVFANLINDDNQIESNKNKQMEGQNFFSQLQNDNGNQFTQNLDSKLNQESQQVKIEAQQYNRNQQGQDFRTPPSRPLKQAKQQKKKIKTAPRPINQANFYEQASHSQSNSQQQQQTKAPEAKIQQNSGYEEKPSSQDFFAQFGSGASGFQQDFGSEYKGHNSQIIEAQQSSIDYADSHSVVSSTVGHMLQSQHLPDEIQSGQVQEQKKMKKKQPKRQIKSIDPDSFI